MEGVLPIILSLCVYIVWKMESQSKEMKREIKKIVSESIKENLSR